MKTDTERTSCDDKSRRCDDVAANQGIPEMVGKPPEARTRQGTIPPEVS